MDVSKFKKECKNALTNNEWCNFEHDYNVMKFYYKESLFHKEFVNIFTNGNKIKIEYTRPEEVAFYDFNKLSENYQNEILKDLKYNQEQSNLIKSYKKTVIRITETLNPYNKDFWLEHLFFNEFKINIWVEDHYEIANMDNPIVEKAFNAWFQKSLARQYNSQEEIAKELLKKYNDKH